MALMPSRTKHRKMQKGSCRGKTTKGCFVEFGDYGMQALSRGWISAQEIEAARVAISRHSNRKVEIVPRIFPDKPISKKPAETRMGKGKGAPSAWVSVIKPGRILFEVSNITKEEAKRALALAAAKFGIKTRFVERLERV